MNTDFNSKSQGSNKISLEELKSILKQKERKEILENKDVVICGKTWKNQYKVIPFHPLYSKLQVVNNARELKHARNMFHVGLLALCENNIGRLFEEAMNNYTNNSIGKLSDCVYTIRKVYNPSNENCISDMLYTVIQFSYPIPFIAIDCIEHEQPGLTDALPTTNPNFFKLGIVIQDEKLGEYVFTLI